MEDSEAEECVDKIETCEPGIESCTMVTYTTKGRTHIRKFCTSIGTPIYQYLLFFPGSALCQNIDTVFILFLNKLILMIFSQTMTSTFLTPKTMKMTSGLQAN
jgi:hypothetical protein